MALRPLRIPRAKFTPVVDVVAQCGGDADFVAWRKRKRHAPVYYFGDTLVIPSGDAAKIVLDFGRDHTALAEREQTLHRRVMYEVGLAAFAHLVPLKPSYPPLPPLMRS